MHQGHHNRMVLQRGTSVIEAARVMLIQVGVAKTFWREAISTTVYTMNRILVKRGKDKNPYEYWHDRSPNVSYFKIFGSKCFIKRGDYVSKFDAKSDEGIFLGYSTKSKAYKCHNNWTKRIIESVDVRVDEYPKVSGKPSEEKKEDEPYILILEPELGKPEDDEVNALVPVQLEPVDSKDDDSEEEEPEANDHTIPRHV